MELSGRALSTRRRSVLKSDSQLSYKLQQFMQSPLVNWVRTFEASLDGDDGQYMEVKALGRTDCQADYLKLVDGVFLNRVMRQIDTNPQTQRIYHNAGNDEVVRVQNLTILVQQIKSFYQEDLQQLILMDLPNVQLLGRDPLSDGALQELEKMLLLLLGCAVQCEDKEVFIGRIQALDLDIQASVASHIQEMTQNQENLVSVQCGDLSSSSMEELHLLFGNMTQHLKELVNQRDENMERIAELIQERELCQLHHGSGAGSCEGGTGHRSGDSREHLTVQLVDLKSKLRRLRQELQEKGEELEDSRQELEELQKDCHQLQKQNRELVLEARAARTYRDEVDILREKATRVDRLQSEVKAYKERLNSIEFYRGKVEEEREYSRALLETKTILEEQLEAARARCDRLHQLEKEGLLLRTALTDLKMEREADRRRIEELLEENLTLEMQATKTADDSIQQRWRTASLSEEFPHSEFMQRPLSDEVNEVTSGQLMMLERENQELRKKAEEIRNASIEADTSQSVKMVSLERENQQMQKMVERLQSEVVEEKENSRNVEGMNNDLMMEKDRMERTMQILRENSEREVEELRLERDQLRQTAEALRQRSQVSSEARVKDIEKENAILHQAMAEAGLRQSTLASERNQALLELEQSRALAEKAEALSRELGRIRLLNEELRGRATELESSLGRLLALEEKASGLQAENGRLRQSLETVTMRLEASEQERARCEEESLRLREAEGAALERAEMENRELGRERDRLRRETARLEGALARGQEQASAYRAAQSELQQLRRSLEGTRGRLSELEKEAEESEAEAQRRQRELEEQRAACGLLEQARQALEQELEQAEGERRQLAKEKRRLRQHAQSRDTSLEEQSQRAAGLELENRRLLQEISRAQEDRDSLAEAQAENSQLLQQLAVSKGEASGLREDLMSEKLRAQGLSNQLDSLSHKLERMGIEQGQVLPAGEESSFRLLEERLDSVFKDTLTIRETHIANLRSQLEDAGRRNQELSDQLQELKRELEEPEQREESPGRTVAMTMEGEAPSEAKSERRESLREVSSDRLIEVERKNATLLAEKQALTVALGQQESANGSLQAQILVLQKHTVSLQEQNSRLQAENSSLVSQNMSVIAQSSQLQSELSAVQSEYRSLVKDSDEVQSRLSSVLRDHEKLVLLHQAQETELDALTHKHGAVKGSYKTLETEHKELDSRYRQLLEQRARLEEMEAAVESRQRILEQEERTRREETDAYHRLREEHVRLLERHSEWEKQQDEERAEQRALRIQLSAMQLERTHTETEWNSLKEQNQRLDLQLAKLGSQCELLNQLKGNLEEENRHLLQQIAALSEDNHTLLKKTVESKDQFHEEQRQYLDKLNELRREKQKLVEKIMDQYRVIDPALPRRKGNWIADKMKRLIKPRKDLSKDQLRPILINPGGGLDTADDAPPTETPEQLQTSSRAVGVSDTLSREPRSAQADASYEDGKVTLRPHRKLSSRIYSSENPRQRFRQRRVGWFPTESEEDEAEGVDSSPSCSSTISRDSDPMLDSKEVSKNPESSQGSQNKLPEAGTVADDNNAAPGDSGSQD